MDEQLINFMKKRHAFERWEGSNTLGENLFVWKFYFTDDNLMGWKAQRIERLDSEEPPAGARGERISPSPPDLVRSVWERLEERPEAVHSIQRIKQTGLVPPAEEALEPQAGVPEPPAAIRSFWRSTEGRPDSLINFNVYECASRGSAHLFLLFLLAQFQSPLLTRREDAEFGDVTFAMPGATVVIFARGNLVHLIRNAGRQVVPVADVARQFDSELVSRPESPVEVARAGVEPRIARLKAGAKKVRAGVDIPLDVEATDPLGADVATPLRARASAPMMAGTAPQTRPIMYKIFAPMTSTVRRERGRLFFRARKAGTQNLTLFAINANRGVTSQVLSFDAE